MGHEDTVCVINKQQQQALFKQEALLYVPGGDRLPSFFFPVFLNFSVCLFLVWSVVVRCY